MYIQYANYIDESKTNMTHISTEKCYKIHAFTTKKNIPMEYWLSDGSYIIVPANEVVKSISFYLIAIRILKKYFTEIYKTICLYIVGKRTVLQFGTSDGEQKRGRHSGESLQNKFGG